MSAGIDLAGKIALISGGASGIGAATARRFIAAGARVAIGDLDVARGEAIARDLGPGALFQRLDVTVELDWTSAIDVIQTRFGTPTTVVNCAGVAVPGDIEHETVEGFRRTLSINLEGGFLGCQAAVRAMKSGAGGAIVNISSTQGERPLGAYPAYAASKGAVRLLTRSVALHCAAQGYDIRCNAILPGAIHTELVEAIIAASEAAGGRREDVIAGFGAAHPMNRMGRPHEPADAIAFLCSDAASFITGADLAVDGGYLA
jgi:3(or 17)beta-hydroxysteroid dehydrogenase